MGPSHVLRNGIALCVALAGLAFSQAAGPSAAWGPVSIGLGVLVGIIFVGWDEIAYLLRPPAREKPQSWRIPP
jgi:hypothetical protein